MLVKKIFHTGVTRSITYVAMTAGNHCSRDDDVISTSLRSAGSVAQDSVQDSMEMKAEVRGAGQRWLVRGRMYLQRTEAKLAIGVR